MTEYEASKVLDDYLVLPEVFKFYGYEIKYNGFCCCPFHAEDTPSCKVNQYQYHCFGCDARGNALSFVKKLFNIDFKTAMQKINADFGLNLLDTELSQEQKLKIQKRKREIYEKNQEQKWLDDIKNDYFEAWRKYVIFKPDDAPNFNIDTPEYLVNEYFENIDERFLQAHETIQRLNFYAELYDFKIEEFEARQMFIYARKRTEQDEIICNIVKLVIEAQREQDRRQNDT